VCVVTILHFCFIIILHLTPFPLPFIVHLLSYYHVMYCPVLSCPVLSCPVLSCPVLSCPVLSCPVLSCPVLSYPILSYPVRNQFHVMYYLIMQGLSEGLPVLMFMLEQGQPVLYCHVRSTLYCTVMYCTVLCCCGVINVPLCTLLYSLHYSVNVIFPFFHIIFSLTDAHSKGLFIGMKNCGRIPFLFLLSIYTFFHYLYALIFFAFFVCFVFNKRFSDNFYICLFIFIYLTYL
jgi:hypothetical protein